MRWCVLLGVALVIGLPGLIACDDKTPLPAQPDAVSAVTPTPKAAPARQASTAPPTVVPPVVPTAGGGAVPPAPAPTPPPKVGAEPRGLAAKGNDPRLVERVADFKNCDLAAERLGGRCNDAKRALRREADREAVPTVLNFLEDDAPWVRYAGAFALDALNLMRTPSARKASGRVLRAAEQVKNPHIAAHLGAALLHGDFADPVYRGAIKALLKTHPDATFKTALVSTLPAQDFDTFFPVIAERMPVETAPALRVAMMKSLYTQARKPGACAFFVTHLIDADEKVAAAAAYNIVWTSGACAEDYDTFLDHFEKRLHAGGVGFMYLLSAVYMAQAEGASDAQRVRFFDALEDIAGDVKQKGMTRATAMDAIAKYSVSGEVFVRRLLDDDDPIVQAAAKRLLVTP